MTGYGYRSLDTQRDEGQARMGNIGSNRDELLTKLASELIEWPASAQGAKQMMPDGWYWRGTEAVHVGGGIESFTVHCNDWLKRREEMAYASGWSEGEKRMDAIGSNGPAGEHYGQQSADAPASNQPKGAQTGGLKFDSDKPRMELLMQGMPRALEAVGAVLTFGAQKYADHSWQHVADNHNRYWAAKVRHDLARARGEQRDPESGLLHLAHEACNTLLLLELALREMEQ